MKKCNHKWVAMEDGTKDKFCVRCRKFAMQAQMAMPTKSETSVSASQPLGRERIEVPFFNGSEHIRVEVYKDDLIKQMNKEVGLDFTPSLLKNAGR